MREITVKLYKFEELSEAAKKKAIENWWDGCQFHWTDEWIESMKMGLSAFDAQLVDWDIDCLSAARSSYRIENHNDDHANELSGVRLRTYLLNNFYSYFFKRKPQGKYTKNEQTGKWSYQRYSKIIYVPTDCPFTGYCGDVSFLHPFKEFIAKPDSRTLDDLLHEAVENCLQGIQQDCEYQQSEEFIADVCEANEYEFTEEGTRA